MIAAQIAAYLLSALTFLAVAYLCLLALASRLGRRRAAARPAPHSKAEVRFVVVIPAHDEAGHIEGTLDSVLGLDYPSALYDVVVVADNCSDRTAEVVRDRGVRCLGRVDPSLRGKGYALEMAFSRVLRWDAQAVVVVDADTKVEANLLQVLNNRLRAGSRAVQVEYGAANCGTGPLAALLCAGNAMENELWRGKQALGLPIFLRGNGMCFAVSVLRENPWQAHSVTEDTQYGIELLRAGVSIDLASETRVEAAVPETLGQLRTQRLRWASGNSALGRGHAMGLIRQGMREGRLGLMDAGWFMLVRSKPLVLLCSLLSAATWPAGLLPAPAALAPGGMFAGLLLLEAFSGGMTPRRLWLLARAPLHLGWLMAIALLGLVNFRGSLWRRTERS